MASPRLIAFEGVDGSGKTTVLSRVARILRARGLPVFLPREGKDHASQPTRQIRDLTRSRQNLDLVPRAELALYCAREAQVLDELVRPALARGETVLMDRSLLTPLVLGAFGRGLDRQMCESMTAAAGAGWAPDLTVLFDVHPRTSRLRKRLHKIRSKAWEAGGRKNLGGSGLQHRIRDGYLALAKERALPVFHSERASVDVMVERVLAFLDHGAQPERSETPADARPVWQVDPILTLEAALASVPPEVAIYLSSGLQVGRALRRAHIDAEPELCAWALDAEDPLFDACAEQHPDYALGSRARQSLADIDAVRLRLLLRHPEVVIASLKRVCGPVADATRHQYASRYPSAVVASLVGREDATAEELRRSAWDGASLESRAASITGCGNPTAWRARDELFEQSAYLGLRSLRGVTGERADRRLLEYADKAEKTVLGALAGRSDGAAHALRTSLLRTGREVVESLDGLDDEASWSLRERLADEYPSTVIHSLRGLAISPRLEALRSRCERLGAGDLHTLCRARQLDEDATATHLRTGPLDAAPFFTRSAAAGSVDVGAGV